MLKKLLDLLQDFENTLNPNTLNTIHKLLFIIAAKYLPKDLHEDFIQEALLAYRTYKPQSIS